MFGWKIVANIGSRSVKDSIFLSRRNNQRSTNLMTENHPFLSHRCTIYNSINCRHRVQIKTHQTKSWHLNSPLTFQGIKPIKFLLHISCSSRPEMSQSSISDSPPATSVDPSSKKKKKKRGKNRCSLVFRSLTGRRWSSTGSQHGRSQRSILEKRTSKAARRPRNRYPAGISVVSLNTIFSNGCRSPAKRIDKDTHLDRSRYRSFLVAREFGPRSLFFSKNLTYPRRRMVSFRVSFSTLHFLFSTPVPPRPWFYSFLFLPCSFISFASLLVPFSVVCRLRAASSTIEIGAGWSALKRWLTSLDIGSRLAAGFQWDTFLTHAM